MSGPQVLLAVLMVVCSGVVAAMVAHRLSVSRDDRAIRRQKLEQLFMAFSGFCKLLVSEHAHYAKVMMGEISYNQALDITINRHRSDEENRHYETIRMLVSLHFEHLKEYAGQVHDVRDRISTILGAFKDQYKAGNFDGKEYVGPFLDALRTVDEVEKRFTQAAREEARRLMGSRS